ncbi:LPXTG cell wall anchor domain-containing protein, partial [Salmonella enterica subsp. enterica serovar Istanbul]|nr:LPXTG cell wall anchor domain-containing protein [Salmonella enterica subsp. enterica serovar Istanbul]
GQTGSSSENGNSGKHTLPQTGEASDQDAPVLGLLMVSLMGLFGLAGTRRRKDDKASK